MSGHARLRVPKPGTVREYLEARISAPAISEAVVANLLEGAGYAPGRIRNVAGGWRNSVVMARAGGLRFVVRRYPDRWSDSAVTHEHSLLLELAHRRFPAPRLIELERGIYLRQIEGARYSVQSFEAGRSLTGYYLRRTEIQRLQRIIGGVLAQFHDALAGYVPRGEHHLGIDSATGKYQRDLSWHLDVIDRMENVSELAAAFGGPADLTSFRRRLIELDELVGRADLPLTIVHGDYGLHNIIFRSNGEAVVHDLELSRTDIRLLDLVTALSRIRPEFRRDFLRGLLDADGVNASELDMLEIVWEWHRLRGGIQSAEAYLRLGGPHRRIAVAKRLTEAKEIRAGRSMVPR